MILMFSAIVNKARVLGNPGLLSMLLTSSQTPNPQSTMFLNRVASNTQRSAALFPSSGRGRETKREREAL